MPALGDRFKAAREARGLSLSDVAEQIRIRSVYLEAIESDNWRAIGAPVYIRGFLRTYARFLGLDGEQIVAEYNLTDAERSELVPVRGALVDPGAGQQRRRRSLSPLIWIASVVAVILVGFVVYNEVMLSKARSNTVVAIASPLAAASTSPSASPLPTQHPPASPVPPGEHAVTVRLSGPCWLRVVVDGTVSIQGTFQAGVVKTVRGKRILLRVGNAGAAYLTVDGQNIGRLGAPGQVVERSVAS
jgi:transcriptional regulator with XRE-family HTH domain